MSRYDRFAPFYDQVVGGRGEVAQLLRRLIGRYNPKAKTVLELGCGSGSMLELLSRHYKVVGMDNSRGMLAIAKQKAPKAKLMKGDITDFNLDQRFDAILCPFDTINHITSFAGWKRVFANAHRHLKPNGIFVFDVNTEHKMEGYRSDPVTAEVEPNLVSMVQVERTRRFNYNVILRIFRRIRGAQFRLDEMVLPELVVPTEKIVRELGTWFRTVTLVDADRRRPSPLTEELYFVCQNPR